MRIPLPIVIMVMCLVTASVHADSDGYFCTGRGYLAFETRLGTPPAKHELHIVRFSTAEGIILLPAVELDNFQVHGMRCRVNEIDVVGWNRTYTVNLADQSIASRAGGAESGTTTRGDNLGHWSRPTVLELDAAGADRFQLVIARVSDGSKAGGIEHHTVSRVVHRRRHGEQIIRSLQLFEGVFHETVH